MSLQKELTNMRCPKCNELLQEEVIHEVPVERCYTCNGIWLDYGEMELIAHRETNQDSWLSKFWKGLSSKKAKTP